MLNILIISNIILIPFIMMMLTNLISKKTFKDREKTSPFECGFDPKPQLRPPFSLQFFLIATIFLIFDVEITLLMPMIMIMPYSTYTSWFITNLIFLIILLLGIYHEWNQGALKWTT
uniref:NADH-ubiquinone oxidoreductase chain 3 n=1 Tax=Rhyzodiastes puetzi TaxID=2983424 RepID=A0A977XS71_9CARA|nr:NADH dehydrogenase subunit 3 [Rhyzodiastes puetzi]UXW64218.1 NADH dehydrogenase subunit 3 [Rhyzodiastes puetzi]